MAHPRDNNLLFDEAEHLYVYRPTGESFVSGTTFIHQFFEEFDGPKIVDKMMASPKWPSSPYFGQTKEQILAKWAQEGEAAAAAGTAMHSKIEREWLGETVDWSDQAAEGAHFACVKQDLLAEGWRPYRLEWRIYTETHKVAGTLDALFTNAAGEFLLVDWKRSKEFKHVNPWQRGKGPVRDLPDCNVIHYTLQLNLYAWILAEHYDIHVKGMRLYSCHPQLSRPSRVDVSFCPVRIVSMFAATA